MKSLILYINEKLKITNDNIEHINTIYPKNRLELLDIIDDKGKNVTEYMDVSDIDISDYVDNLGIIFYLNDNLTEIDGLETWDLSKWKIDKDADLTKMFNGCPDKLIKSLPKHILDRIKT